MNILGARGESLYQATFERSRLEIYLSRPFAVGGACVSVGVGGTSVVCGINQGRGREL